MKDFSRRRFVLGTAAVAATGALAGCSGNGGGNGNGNGNGNGGGSGPQGRGDEFLSGGDANQYDGSFADQTGQDEVTISVGAGDGYGFDPAAIRVDAGTTIVWEWTGQGGGHNVVSEDASDFEFANEGESIVEEEGHTYEHTFEEAGLAAYVCIPHRAQGMLGAIVVE